MEYKLADICTYIIFFNVTKVKNTDQKNLYNEKIRSLRSNGAKVTVCLNKKKFKLVLVNKLL